MGNVDISFSTLKLGKHITSLSIIFAPQPFLMVDWVEVLDFLKEGWPLWKVKTIYIYTCICIPKYQLSNMHGLYVSGHVIICKIKSCLVHYRVLPHRQMYMYMTTGDIICEYTCCTKTGEIFLR